MHVLLIYICDTEDAFQAHIASLIVKQLEPAKTLDAEFGLLYSEVSSIVYACTVDPVTLVMCL